MYKELRKRIKASRPIGKRQKVLNIALLAIVLASIAVFLWSVANVARANNKEAEAVRIKYAQKADALMQRGLIESY